MCVLCVMYVICVCEVCCGVCMRLCVFLCKSMPVCGGCMHEDVYMPMEGNGQPQVASSGAILLVFETGSPTQSRTRP